MKFDSHVPVKKCFLVPDPFKWLPTFAISAQCDRDHREIFSFVNALEAAPYDLTIFDQLHSVCESHFYYEEQELDKTLAKQITLQQRYRAHLADGFDNDSKSEHDSQEKTPGDDHWTVDLEDIGNSGHFSDGEFERTEMHPLKSFRPMIVATGRENESFTAAMVADLRNKALDEKEIAIHKADHEAFLEDLNVMRGRLLRRIDNREIDTDQLDTYGPNEIAYVKVRYTLAAKNLQPNRAG